MPALPEPTTVETVELPARKARMAGECDVLVVGGGPSGIAAALSAAGAGARVILTERNGFLGGSPTAALVMPIASYYTHSEIDILPPRFSLFPKDHGKGYPVEAGIMEQLLKRLIREKGAYQPVQQNGYTVPFDPEIYKLVCQEIADDAGVQVLLHALASGYVYENGQPGVVFETKSGPLVIQSRVICDCTGDGDIAFWAGAEYAIGREKDGLTQPMSLLFRIMDFNHGEFKDYVNNHPGEWDGVRGLEQLVRKACADGKLNLPREDILFFGTPHPREVSVNSTRVTNVLGTNVWDLTKAEWESRYQLRQIARFLREYVPGFKASYVGESATTVSVRESRRILGDYVLTQNDLLTARKFDDAIARATYPIDEHNPSGKGTVIKDIPYNDYYEIPLRCLLPKGLDSIIVGGRCISGTHLALSSYRVIPISIATGQAAGVCAAFASRHRVSIHSVPYHDVRAELLKQGAIL